MLSTFPHTLRRLILSSSISRRTAATSLPLFCSSTALYVVDDARQPRALTHACLKTPPRAQTHLYHAAAARGHGWLSYAVSLTYHAATAASPHLRPPAAALAALTFSLHHTLPP